MITIARCAEPCARPVAHPSISVERLKSPITDSPAALFSCRYRRADYLARVRGEDVHDASHHRSFRSGDITRAVRRPDRCSRGCRRRLDRERHELIAGDAVALRGNEDARPVGPESVEGAEEPGPVRQRRRSHGDERRFMSR
jgi:hypothetical protein